MVCLAGVLCHPRLLTLCAGNHDCLGSIDALLEYAKASQYWKFPSRYYFVDYYLKKARATVRFIVLDTCALTCGGSDINYRFACRSEV